MGVIIDGYTFSADGMHLVTDNQHMKFACSAPNAGQSRLNSPSLLAKRD